MRCSGTGRKSRVSKEGLIPAVWPLGRPFPSPSLVVFICKNRGGGQGEPCLNVPGLPHPSTTQGAAPAREMGCLTVLGPRCGQGRAPSEGARKASFRASPGFCRDGYALVDSTLWCSTSTWLSSPSVLSPPLPSGSVSKFLPSIRTPVIWGLAPTLVTSTQLHYLYKDPLSK